MNESDEEQKPKNVTDQDLTNKNRMKTRRRSEVSDSIVTKDSKYKNMRKRRSWSWKLSNSSKDSSDTQEKLCSIDEGNDCEFMSHFSKDDLRLCVFDDKLKKLVYKNDMDLNEDVKRLTADFKKDKKQSGKDLKLCVFDENGFEIDKNVKLNDDNSNGKLKALKKFFTDHRSSSDENEISTENCASEKKILSNRYKLTKNGAQVTDTSLINDFEDLNVQKSKELRNRFKLNMFKTNFDILGDIDKSRNRHSTDDKLFSVFEEGFCDDFKDGKRPNSIHMPVERNN